MEPQTTLHSDEARGRAMRNRMPSPGPGPGATATTTRTEVPAMPAVTPAPGLAFERYFTTPGVDPFDTVEWELRNALISNEKGEKVFEQKDVEMPKFWSQTATNVVVSKYFRGQLGSPDRERS